MTLRARWTIGAQSESLPGRPTTPVGVANCDAFSFNPFAQLPGSSGALAPRWQGRRPPTEHEPFASGAHDRRCPRDSSPCHGLTGLARYRPTLATPQHAAPNCNVTAPAPTAISAAFVQKCSPPVVAAACYAYRPTPQHRSGSGQDMRHAEQRTKGASTTARAHLCKLALRSSLPCVKGLPPPEPLGDRSRRSLRHPAAAPIVCSQSSRHPVSPIVGDIGCRERATRRRVGAGPGVGAGASRVSQRQPRSTAHYRPACPPLRDSHNTLLRLAPLHRPSNGDGSNPPSWPATA